MTEDYDRNALRELLFDSVDPLPAAHGAAMFETTFADTGEVAHDLYPVGADFGDAPTEPYTVDEPDHFRPDLDHRSDHRSDHQPDHHFDPHHDPEPDLDTHHDHGPDHDSDPGLDHQHHIDPPW
ncbi:hypothetical protein [Actinokineospora enzanensis]|uniref:hypothetical protein n=1 Tax=Actinokineospora enzanensis TaxID=155975 RepID=UPI00036C1F92|nr:hypothetical protein [Actinokineospora enzanensis]